MLQFVHFVLCSVLCSFPLPARARLQRSQVGFCAVQPARTQSFILVWEGKSFRALWFYSAAPAAEKFTMGSVASCSGKRPRTFMTTSQPVSRSTRLQNYNNNHAKFLRYEIRKYKKYILVTTVTNVQMVDWRTRDGKNLRTFTKT